jgi:lipoprotein NlpD
MDYRELAKLNGIGGDYVIHPGQVLKLRRGAQTASAKASPATRPAPIVTRALPRPVGPPIPWKWPVEGGAATLTTRPNGGQGLTISGRLGQEIRSASDGRVVYSGSGLYGYGQLLIIKHSETYLSAYGHTQSVSVKEGQKVSAGEQVATMGTGPQGVPLLYFEIRVNGAPANPLTLLPQR